MRIEVKQGRRIPGWVVEHVGCKVRTTVPVKIGAQEFPAGSMALLQSIQAGRRSPYATVVMDGDRIESEENIQFCHIRPL